MLMRTGDITYEVQKHTVTSIKLKPQTVGSLYKTMEAIAVPQDVAVAAQSVP